MLPLALLSILLGIVLGTRFKVYILLPAVLAVVTLSCSAGVVSGWSGGLTALMMGIATIGVQLGYLVGTFLRLVLVVLKVKKTVRPEFGNQSFPTRV